MKKPKELTKNEWDVILEMRKKEDLESPKKSGVLKHDLYYRYDIECLLESISRDICVNWDMFCFNGIITDIKSELNSLEPYVKSGTTFSCYLDADGDELWYDDINCGIEDMDSAWAEKYLTDIKEL